MIKVNDKGRRCNNNIRIINKTLCMSKDNMQKERLGKESTQPDKDILATLKNNNRINIL